MRLSTPEAIAIYNEYPRKVGKPEALRKILVAISKHGYDFVLTQTRAFADRARQVGRPMELIPHPSTFFNQERYADDLDAALPLPAAKTPVKAQPPAWQRLKAVEALLEENKKALQRSPLPDQFHYDWVNGKCEKYDRDFKLAQDKRTQLKEHRAKLEAQRNALQQEVAGA